MVGEGGASRVHLSESAIIPQLMPLPHLRQCCAPGLSFDCGVREGDGMQLSAPASSLIASEAKGRAKKHTHTTLPAV